MRGGDGQKNPNLKYTDGDVPTLPAGSTPATRTRAKARDSFFMNDTRCEEHEPRDGFRIIRLVMSINNPHNSVEKDDGGSGRAPGGRKRLPVWRDAMGWEYEDLFNNRMAGDGSFLEEPCFIPVGRMGYRRRTTVSGPRIDAEVFPVFGRRQRGELRRAKHQMTPEAQQRANDERSRMRLIQLVEANFSEKDVAVGLDYAGEAPTPERVDKDIRNFLARVRRARAKRGLSELKYIYAIGGDEMPAAGYSGKRPHIHMMMNGGIDRDELEKMWGHGRANCDRLQPRDEGLGGIAVYFTRQKQDRAPKKGVRKWRGSRNLKQPVRRSRDARIPNNRVRRIAYDFRNEAKAVMEKLYPGYVFQDCTVKYSDVVPGVYIRCVLRRMRT